METTLEFAVAVVVGWCSVLSLASSCRWRPRLPICSL